MLWLVSDSIPALGEADMTSQARRVEADITEGPC